MLCFLFNNSNDFCDDVYIGKFWLSVDSIYIDYFYNFIDVYNVFFGVLFEYCIYYGVMFR